MIKDFDLSAVRLPGGNWISGWEWENSIGLREQRKTQLDFAWRQYEPNTIGHDEYLGQPACQTCAQRGRAF